jgi:hypothetical protein
MLMLETTLDDLLGADVDVVDRDEKVGNHMLYMISTELLVINDGTTSSVRAHNAFISLARLHAVRRNEPITPLCSLVSFFSKTKPNTYANHVR